MVILFLLVLTLNVATITMACHLSFILCNVDTFCVAFKTQYYRVNPYVQDACKRDYKFVIDNSFKAPHKTPVKYGELSRCIFVIMICSQSVAILMRFLHFLNMMYPLSST